MVRDFRRRFLVFSAVGWPAGALALWLVAGWKPACAFALTFLLVAADFLWMAAGLERLLGSGPPPKGWGRGLLVGMAFRTLLLLLGLYAILTILPRESLGVVLGIGGPLVLLAAAGALRAGG